jgi:hypothetical protein
VYRAESSLDLFGKNIDVYRASDLMYFFLCEGIVVGETLLQCEALLVVVAVRLMLHMTACFGKVLFHLFIFFLFALSYMRILEVVTTSWYYDVA